MCKKLKKENLKPHLSQLVKYWCKGAKYPFPVVAVKRIEAIDHIDWLHNELNIYGGGFESICGLVEQCRTPVR